MDAIDEMILAADAEERIERNKRIWLVPAIKSDIPDATASKRCSEVAKRIIQEQGIDLVCEHCGMEFRVHPSMRDRAFACGKVCSHAARFKRLRGDTRYQRAVWIPKSKRKDTE